MPLRRIVPTLALTLVAALAVAGHASAVPLLTSAIPSSGPAAGGPVITLIGQDFGAPGDERMVTFADVTAGNVEWLSTTMLRCTLPPGVPGSAANVVLTVRGVVSNALVFNYHPPQIASVSPTSGPTQGGFPITIFGANFGVSPSYSRKVTVGGMTATGLVWSSDSYMVCVAPENPPGTHNVVVTVQSSSSAGWPIAYDPPVVTGLTPASGPASGGTPLTIIGQNFGPATAPRSVYVGSAIATDVTWMGHTMLTCVSPPGTPGSAQAVTVVVDGYAGMGGTFTYDGPVVTSLTPSSGPTSGGILLTIRGQNFGDDPGTPRSVRIGGGGGGAGGIIWVSSTELHCPLPEGDPGPQGLQVTVGGATSPVHPFAYAPPFLAVATPSSGPARGGVRLTLTGTNFGRQAAPRSITVGPVPAPEVEWLGHHAIVCQLPPGVPGSSADLRVASGGTSSNTIPFQYQGPSIATVSPNSGPLAGGTIITIRGENFGVDGASVRFGGALSNAQPPFADDQILCVLPAGSSGHVPVIVAAGAGADTLENGFFYDASTTGVPGHAGGAPTAFALRQNTPNPVPSHTTIGFDLPEASDFTVTVFDLQGRVVRRTSGAAGPGTVTVTWDATDASGTPVPSGVYFYRVQAGRFMQTKRMLVAR